MEKIHEIDSLLCKPDFSSATKTSLCIKKIKSNHYSKVTGGNATNIILKRMLRYFLKTPPLKKMLKFQEKICSFIKNTKNNLFNKYLVEKHQI